MKEEMDLNDYVLKRISTQKTVTYKGGEIKDHSLYLFACDLSEYLFNDE